MTPFDAMVANAPPAGAWQGVAWALARDLKLALRTRPELGVLLLFYVIVVTLFPLGVGPEPGLLRALGPGVLWVAALLASLLSLPRLFASDFADGMLEQIALSPYPLPALIAGKIAAHWASTGLPLVIVSPLLGLQFGLGGDELDGNIALQPFIAGPIDYAHPARAERRQDLIGAKMCTWSERHNCPRL